MAFFGCNLSNLGSHELHFGYFRPACGFSVTVFGDQLG
jgi:hypothetical protein